MYNDPKIKEYDPYAFLEITDDHKSLRWVADQNERAIRELSVFDFKECQDILIDAYAERNTTVFVDRCGDFAYAIQKSEVNPKGTWQRTTWQRYTSGDPEWQILLDIDNLCKNEGQNWVWQTAVMSAASFGRAMIGLSDGGADAIEFREFDVESCSFVIGGFHLPVARQVVSWYAHDTLVVLSTLGDGHKTKSGYYRTVRLLHRSQEIDDADIIFEVDAAHMRAIAHVDHSADSPKFLFVDSVSISDNRFYYGCLQSECKPITLPQNAWMSPRGEFVAIYVPQEWTFSGKRYPSGSLLVGRILDLIDGTGSFEILFVSTERSSVQKYFWAGEYFVLSVLDNLRPLLFRFQISPDGWAREKIQIPKEDGALSVWSVDLPASEGNGDIFLVVEDLLTPRSVFVLEAMAAPKLLFGNRSFSRADGLSITRHEAVSSDGECIPYVQVGPVGRTGDAPVLMYGYGGFGISLSPCFDLAVYKLWLEKGGTYVLTHLRGGGEFGSRWRYGGTRGRKSQSHDDFAAVASDLVVRGVTSPKRIAAHGMSNGGLLIANMLTRYPDRFGALFCANPLTDMLRFSVLGAGAAVVAEYGDPSDAGDQEHLKRISAYHNIEANRDYPPILFTTSRTDDRVHPAHARKMTARLQEYGYKAWLYEAKTGGHSYGNDSVEKAAVLALAYSFLWKTVTVGIYS